MKKVKDKLLAVPGGGWKPENAKLIDKGKATVKAISDAIDEIKKKAKPGDEFLFYFVGHGANGWIGPGPDGKFDTEPAGDDVFNKERTGILPGSDGVLQTQPKGDDVLVGPKDADGDEPNDANDNWIGVDNKEHITDDDLAKMLSGFPYSVSMVIVLDACFTASFTDGAKDLESITQKRGGKDVRACKVQFMGVKSLEPDEILTRGFIDALEWLPSEKKTRADSDGDGNGVTDTKEIFDSGQQGMWKQWTALNFDNDRDSLIDEDLADHIETIEDGRLVLTHLLIDDDGDGLIDEDPDPVAFNHEEWAFTVAEIQSSDQTGKPKNVFKMNDNVYVKGSFYPFDSFFDVFVTLDMNWTDGMLIPTRVPETATTVSSDSAGNIAPTVVWEAPLVPGKYDIVVDVNGNGKFDADIDALLDDEVLVTAGFFVIPEYPLGTILGLVMTLAALAVLKSKRMHLPRIRI